MTKVILFLIPSAFLFSSCDKIKEREFSLHLVKNFEINILEDDSFTFSQTETFSASEDDDIKNSLDDIKSYKLVRLSAKIWEYEGSATAEISGSLCFGKNAAGDVCHELDATKMLELITSEERVDLDYTQAQFEKLAGVLMENHQITGVLEGMVTEKPMRFIFQAVADIDVVIEVKD